MEPLGLHTDIYRCMCMCTFMNIYIKVPGRDIPGRDIHLYVLGRDLGMGHDGPELGVELRRYVRHLRLHLLTP